MGTFWERIKKAWSIYRHWAAIKGLLETLGWWAWVVHAAGFVLAFLVARLAPLPLWAQAIVGLLTMTLLVFLVGFMLVIKRAWGADVEVLPEAPNPAFSSPAPSGEVPGTVRLKIISAGIGERLNRAGQKSLYVMLQISTIGLKPDMKIGSWKLTLKNEDGIFSHASFVPENVTVCFGVPMVCYALTANDLMSQEWSTRLNAERDGYTLFRLQPLSPVLDQEVECRALGCDFHVEAYDWAGRRCTDARRSGKWISRVKFSFEADGIGVPGVYQFPPTLGG